MKIAVGSDHAGFALKEHLKVYLEAKGHSISDQGAFALERCDYPDFAEKVCRAIQEDESERGILICGTGIGMSMAANRFDGIRAAVVTDLFCAEATRAHNDCNVLCLGERVVGFGLAQAIVDIWCATHFQGGRHQLRVDKLRRL